MHNNIESFNLVGVMLNYSLYVDRSLVNFFSNSKSHRLITNDDMFRTKILTLAKKIPVNTTQVFYTSFRPKDKGLIAAYGNLKMAISISRRKDNRLLNQLVALQIKQI